MRAASDRLLIAAAVIALQLGGLGTTPILDRDEARFAEAARDMRERGDGVVPYFNGEPRYHKPILIYWLLWGSFEVLGPTELAVRLPSVLCGAALAVLIYELGRELHSRRAGLLAALLTASAPLVWIESRVGTADAALAASLATAFLSYRRSKVSGRPFLWSAAAGAFLGLATLAKGPVALFVFGLAALASALLLLASPRMGDVAAAPGPSPRRWLLLALGLSAFLAVALPWSILAGLRTHWEFWKEGIGYHFAGRLSQSYEGHRMFPGAHTLLLAANCFPWSPLIPPAVLAGLRGVRAGDPRPRFLLGWALGPLLMFEAASSRLPHYTLPILPAFALLVAGLLAGPAPGSPPAPAPLPGLPAKVVRSPAILVLSGGALAMALWPALTWLALGRLGLTGRGARLLLEALGPAAAWIWIPGAALAAGGVLARRLAARAASMPSLLAALGGWCAALALSSTLVVPRLPPLGISRAIEGAIAVDAKRATGGFAFLVSYKEPSLIFYLRRDLFPGPGQVEEAAAAAAAQAIAGGRRPAWIVAGAEDLERIAQAAPVRQAGVRIRTAARVRGINISKGEEMEIFIARAD